MINNSRFLSRKMNKSTLRISLARITQVFIILAFLISPVGVKAQSAAKPSSAPLQQAAETSVAKYFDDRAGAMALNYDTELYLCGMIHSGVGYDPAAAAARSQKTRIGWPNLISDAETYGIPLSFNICGHEAVFGDTGKLETAAIDVFHDWPVPYWQTHTWYSDKPLNGGNYQTVGDLSGIANQSYGLIYGGDMTEQALNSEVPFEISLHNFGHEDLGGLTLEQLNDTFSLSVEYHKRIGNKIRAEAPPWNSNADSSKYPIYTQNGIFVFNRAEGPMSEPSEDSPDLWIIPRANAFDVNTDLRSTIDAAISGGVVFADYSHPEDGFDSPVRTAFQTSLAYAKTKVDSGELWATTLSEIGRYWEAKSDVSNVTSIEDGKTVVDSTLTDYNAALFGIPYLTFQSPMPNSSAYAKITVDYPSTQTLNSNSATVRVANGIVTYSLYLNPAGATHVEIEGVDAPFTGGVDINKPVLSIDSTPPAEALKDRQITLQATSVSTDAVYSANLIYWRNGGAKASLEMGLNAGTWEAQVGPFNAHDVVNYYVSVTDNSGRRERSQVKTFTVQAGPDETDPTWRGQGQSNVTGRVLQLYAQGMDETALRSATLETDETGSWGPRATYGSPMNLGDVYNTWVSSSFSWNNPSVPAGSTVYWRIVYADAAGNVITTAEMAFTIQDVPVDSQPPQYSSPNVSSMVAGQSAEFSLRWTDNEALDSYSFSFDDGSGTLVEDNYTGFTESATGGNWWNAAWPYRTVYTVDNQAGATTLTDYPVLITVDTAGLIAAGRLNENGGDLRFLDGTTELSFWVESGLNTALTRIWVKVPSIPAGGTKTISMYFGNPDRQVSQSDGSKAFPIFDSFGGTGWEGSKYSTPVMGEGSPAGGSGTFSSVIRESDTLWRMYSSYDSDGMDIGMSTSTDGINWTHQGVVLRKGEPGAWDSSNLWCPAVWKEAGTYYMMYPANGSAPTSMGLATSPDGINWTKDPRSPVFIDPYWAQGDTESPCFSVMKDNGTYYVMYNTLGAGQRQSGIAYSTDLIHWTPAYNYPRFAGSTDPNAWNHNMFCGHMFKYEDMYYIIIPGQDSSHDYAKFGLYVSHSPLFPENDTEFKGIVLTGTPGTWDAGDMDTPWIVPSLGKMYLYYAGCGACWSQTGLAILDDFPQALAEAYPPGNYLNVDRTPTASLQVMPPAGWQKSIPGYQEVNSQNFEITLNPAVTGRATGLKDLNGSLPLSLYRDVATTAVGSVSAWVRTDTANSGDYDLLLSGDTHANLALSVGLGANGVFHYWNGSPVDSSVSYAPDTWYRIQVNFDTVQDKYDLAVYNTADTVLLQVNDIAFGTAITSGVDQVKFQTSDAYNGHAYLDDFLFRRAAAVEPTVTAGPASSQGFTDAWSRVTRTLPSTPGSTIRWRFSARDTSANPTDSEIYTFVTEAVNTPPTVTLNAPADRVGLTSSNVTFNATCTDETNISQVSLWGDWSGAWSLVETRNDAGLNGTETVFSKVVPDGDWTWNVECRDNSGQTTLGTARSFFVDTAPAPWWHSGYHYRARLTAQENSGHALTDYPLFAVVDTAALIADGKMKIDCSDVRVTENGAEIPSQVTGCNTATSRVWLQTDLGASAAKRNLYMYYGFPGASAPDYSAQSSLNWNSSTFTLDTGKITATFNPAGGIINQISNNSNHQSLLSSGGDKGLGYLFSHTVNEIFLNNETDDQISLTDDGPIVKVITAFSGESPQWTQQNIFYNNADFIDFIAQRPGGSSDLFLVGSNHLTPDGVFSTADSNELLRTDNLTSDTTVTFNDAWHYVATTNKGYMGLVDPSFTNELAFLWNKAQNHDFSWKSRADDGGAYSLFIGGDGSNWGTINADTFGYRFVLRDSANPSNSDTQPMLDYAITNPPSLNIGGEEFQAADTTAPTVTITSPTNTTYENDTISLAFSVSEAVQWCGYSLDGGDPVAIPNCANVTIGPLAHGTYELTVNARDYGENTGSASVSFTVTGDVTPPTVTITSPTNTSYETGPIALEFSVSEAVEWCGYSLNGADPVTIPNCANTTLGTLPHDTYALIVSARDYAGNTGSSSVSFTVIADVNAPTVTISSPTHTSYPSFTVPLNFTASEPVDLCSYTLNGGAPVTIVGCGSTAITVPANGVYDLTVTARDLSGNIGSASVNFDVSFTPNAWWDTAWHYRFPVTIQTGGYVRTNEPVEVASNFTTIWTGLGESGPALDPNSIRVIEYDSSGALIGEVVSQFDQAADYDPATNAAGKIDWILSGTNPVGTSRYFYVYFDSTANLKSAPGYSTSLAWNSSTNTLGNGMLSSSISDGDLQPLVYNTTTYTTGPGSVPYMPGSSGSSYAALIDGPVKKSVRVSSASRGDAVFTLYAQSQYFKVTGDLTASNWGFTVFPYAWRLNSAVLTANLHYFDLGAVVNESVTSQAWLGHHPQEGWACYDGSGANAGLCLATDPATLASSNDLWRYGDGQLIFPAWNPGIGFPLHAVSYVVMANTYQEGRDFWNKLSAPMSQVAGTPEKYQAAQPPVVGDIPDQTIASGGSFATISLDNFVTDPDTADADITWSATGNTALTVQISADRVATISYPLNWTGSETVTFTATDPTLLSDGANVAFSVSLANDAPVAVGDSYTTNEDTVLTVPAPGVLGNDTDAGPLTAIQVSDPSHGTFDLNADGSFTYTPEANYHGSDTFSYKANDGSLDSSEAAVTITVTPVNDAPGLDAIGNKVVNEGALLSFTATASDVDTGDTLTFTLTGAPAGATITTGGVFSWTPTQAQAPNTYSFDICVSDATASDCETITVIVNTPGDFNKVNPSHGAILETFELTLSWGSSANAIRYEYCIDTSVNRLCDTEWISTGSNTQVAVSNLENDTTYSWQVRAISPDGTVYANNDIWWQFTIAIPHDPRAGFSARLPDNEVHGYGWPLESSVTLTIDDPENGTGIDYTATQTVVVADWDPNQTFVPFRVWQNGFELRPGQLVKLTDRITTKTHTIRSLTVTGMDPAADTVSGTAEAGSLVEVESISCRQINCSGLRHVTADGNGHWIADFAHTGSGQDEQGVVNLTVGTAGEARQADDDHDATTVPWSIQASLVINTEGNGSVNLDPPAGMYDVDTVVQLTAVPDAGWIFAGWSGDLDGSDNPAFLTMDGNKNITANFISAANIVLQSPTGDLTSWNNTFSWSGMSGANYYILEVYDENSGGMLLRQWFALSTAGCDSDTNCAVFPESLALLANGSYKWRIQDYGSEYGYGQWTPFLNFTLTRPESMVLQSPSGDLTSWNNIFSWSGMSGANYYILEVYDTSSNAMLLRQWFALSTAGCDSDTSCAVSPETLALLANGSYKWRVQDYGSEYGYGMWTPFLSFTLTRPESMVLQSPSGDLTSWNNIFSWSGMSGANYYILEVYDTTSNAMILRQWFALSTAGCDSDTSCAVSPETLVLLANGSYKWRIQDYGSEYGYGMWTPFLNFTLNTP